MRRIPMRVRAVIFAIAALVVVAWHPVVLHARAASLLARFGAPDHGPSPDVREEAIAIAPLRAGDAPIRARIYAPASGATKSGIVLAPGVHRLGIDEPRLVRFARAVSASGLVVLTPEIRELTDYRIEAASIDTIGLAARPEYAPDVAFVVAVGAHDDLARVARFFATNAIPRPDGSIATLRAHEYGPLVLVYDRLEDFFPEGDVPAVRDSLRFWLWEERDRAREKLALVHGPSHDKLEALYEGKLDAVAPEILAEIDRRAGEMSAASPHDHLASLRAPVLLLHGAGDSVIPASETLWLARDVPRGLVRDVLVSPAVVHVELEGEPTLADKWALVHFMADVLGESSR